jgi:putative aldouronate transport system substrate-binding protein
MKKEKVLCALLATAMTAGAVMPCAASAYPTDENGYPDLGGETITIWFNMTTANAQATSDLGEYAAIKEIEEKFNVNFEFIHPPVGQAQDNFTIMMADTTLPDMIFCGGIDNYYPGGIEMAYADGILFDYTDYINEEYTPNFYSLIENDEFLKKAVTDDEGRIVRLGAKICGSEEADLTFTGALIRKDYLEAAGFDDVPTTIDEWTQMLAAMKENGVKYPLALDGDGSLGKYFSTNFFSSAFGVSAGDYYVKEDGTVAYGPYEDSYKDYLELLHSWYEAGYINPDFTTQNESTLMSLASADEVGSMLMHLYTYGTTYYVTTEMEDESKALIPAPAPVLNEGDDLAELRTSSRSLGDYKYITADCKNVEACIALLDALYLDDIDELLANGIEGVAYTKEDGVITPNTIASDADTETLLSMAPQQWHTFEDTDLNYILTQKYNKGCQDEALVLWKEQGTSGTLSNFIMLNSDEAEIQSSYQADIKTYVEEMVLKFIMGQESLDNFGEYQETLKSLHIEDMIAIKQAAMDRFEAR